MKRFLREQIVELKPYEAHVNPHSVKMDANENPFPWPDGMKEEVFSQNYDFNRYPDGSAIELRKVIAQYNRVETENVLVGNGSDELIQIIFNTFGGSGRAVMIHPPTFSMYASAARITDTSVIEVPLLEGVRLDTADMIAKCQGDPGIKVIIICNPNNPTGALFPWEEVQKLLDETDCLVVVDEAYTEFAGETFVDKIAAYPKLLVMRTFSKAFGMAALRLGYVMGCREIINFLNKVRQPFNVNSFSQRVGVIAFKYVAEYQKQIDLIKKETELLYNGLKGIPCLKVLPTRANFILFKAEDSNSLAKELGEAGFTVRNLGEILGLGKCLRMSSGTPEENRCFLETIKSLL
ncbi:MAG: histidinol-phosphate transaminase [Eubacteriales bacterium]